MEYLAKNGSPRCVGEFKDEMYQLRTLGDFSLYEQSIDRGASSIVFSIGFLKCFPFFFEIYNGLSSFFRLKFYIKIHFYFLIFKIFIDFL